MILRFPAAPFGFALALCATAHASAQDHDGHGRASVPVAPSPLAIALDADTLAALPVATVEATAHGQTLRCQGVSLSALLARAGALPNGPLRGPRLASYVLVTARDGYRVVYSLAELDPTLGHRDVVLANQCDGRPLDPETGPLRLIAPGESRPARWVRQVESITVVAAP